MTAPTLTQNNGMKLSSVITLASLFVLILTVADIAATKFIILGNVVTPAGAMLFAAIFVIRDMLHKQAGAKFVRHVIHVAIAANIAVGFYLYTMTLIPAPGFRPSDAFDTVFALAPGIVIGSIVAAFASQHLNTIVYQRLWERGAKQWVRTVGSNVASLPVDAVLFTFVGFVLVPMFTAADPLSFDAAFARVASGQTLFKAAVMLACTPLIYLIKTNPNAIELK